MKKYLVAALAAFAMAAVPATAQAITASQAADRAQLYYQAHTPPRRYNPASFYWVCEERFFGWACTSFVTMRSPYCIPPVWDRHMIVTVHMNQQGNGRRFTKYECSRLA